MSWFGDHVIRRGAVRGGPARDPLRALRPLLEEVHERFPDPQAHNVTFYNSLDCITSYSHSCSARDPHGSQCTAAARLTSLGLARDVERLAPLRAALLAGEAHTRSLGATPERVECYEALLRLFVALLGELTAAAQASRARTALLGEISSREGCHDDAALAAARMQRSPLRRSWLSRLPRELAPGMPVLLPHEPDLLLDLTQELYAASVRVSTLTRELQDGLAALASLADELTRALTECPETPVDLAALRAKVQANREIDEAVALEVVRMRSLARDEYPALVADAHRKLTS